MDGASGAGTPAARRTAPRPDRGGAGRRARRPRRAEAARPCSRCSRSSLDASSPSIGSSKRSGPATRPKPRAHAVQVYVSQLRKALGPVIATRAPGYELELAPERVDLHRFARLTQDGRAALDGRRSGLGRGGAARGTRALARAGARGLPLRAVRPDRDRAARGAAHRHARGADRG